MLGLHSRGPRSETGSPGAGWVLAEVGVPGLHGRGPRSKTGSPDAGQLLAKVRVLVMVSALALVSVKARVPVMVSM